MASSLTCCSQADVQAASLELAAALGLWHNELAALVEVGDEGGEVVVPAAGEKRRGSHVTARILALESLGATLGNPTPPPSRSPNSPKAPPCVHARKTAGSQLQDATLQSTFTLKAVLISSPLQHKPKQRKSNDTLHGLPAFGPQSIPPSPFL